jgi:hypothetical protein
MNVEVGRQNIIIIFGNNEAAQFHFWKYINWNQTRDLYWILAGPSFSVRDPPLFHNNNPMKIKMSSYSLVGSKQTTCRCRHSGQVFNRGGVLYKKVIHRRLSWLHIYKGSAHQVTIPICWWNLSLIIHCVKHKPWNILFISTLLYTIIDPLQIFKFQGRANNYLCTHDLYSSVHNVLDACISLTRASGKGSTPPTCPSNGFACIQNIMHRAV